MNFFQVLQRLLVLTLLLATSSAMAEPQLIRWTGSDDADSDLIHVIGVLKAMTGFPLKTTEFALSEERDLATSKYRYYLQTVEGKPLRAAYGPVKKAAMSLRIWSNRETGSTIQVEALVEDPSVSGAMVAALKKKGFSPKKLSQSLSEHAMAAITRETIRAKNPDDTRAAEFHWTEEWVNGDLVRIMRAKGRRGWHNVTISLRKKQAVAYEYNEFPQADIVSANEFGDEFAWEHPKDPAWDEENPKKNEPEKDPDTREDELQPILARLYPVYEQPEGSSTILERKESKLKYLKKKVTKVSANPYESLKTQRYLEKKYDPVLGETDAGRAQGYWAMSYILREAGKLKAQLPMVDNSFENGGVLLDGRYATINLHNDAPKKFPGLSFTPAVSTQFRPDWRPYEENGEELWEMIPSSALLGKPLLSAEDALNRLAERLPNHDPAKYIEAGFDELQVYYAINTLFEALAAMGFSDPDLSTRPFHAFLYDPDISMQDNAYYTDDTINFTTYSPENQNFARDNPTIWHELGHGIMDRLMGPSIRLADTGGLSEGMADFVAALVLEAATGGTPFEGSKSFRIINKTGFFLTNEVHDDGEAYGGAMKDLLDAALAQFGRDGLKKVTDLTLEAMRLCRNHPALTAQDWFNHMLFADELGKTGVRDSGELSPLILKALAGRNFDLEGKAPATFVLKNGQTEVGDSNEGSRSKPIVVTLKADEKAEYQLSIEAKSSATYAFHFPLEVRVSMTGGPLQGAIHWEGEETGPIVGELNSEADVLNVGLAVRGTCDAANRDDGSCVDFAYVGLFQPGDSKPVAKKRFYLRVKTKKEEPAPSPSPEPTPSPASEPTPMPEPTPGPVPVEAPL